MSEQVRSFTPLPRDCEEVASFLKPFFELACIHCWRGYGSTIFLEFGALAENGLRRDGSRRNPRGEWNLCLNGSWRTEGKRLIWCGSETDEHACESTFKTLLGKKVSRATFAGHFLEIDLQFENGLHLVSFMPYRGNPDWCLLKTLPTGYQAISSREGRIVLETSVKAHA